MPTNSRWWALYSFRQRATHIEQEQEALARNQLAFELNRPVDFVPLASFATEAEARSYLDEVEAIRKRREAVEKGGAPWKH